MATRGRPPARTTLTPTEAAALHPACCAGRLQHPPDVVTLAVVTTAVQVAAMAAMPRVLPLSALIASQDMLAASIPHVSSALKPPRDLTLCSSRPYIAMAALIRAGLAPAQVAASTVGALMSTHAEGEPSTRAEAEARVVDFARDRRQLLRAPRVGNVPAGLFPLDRVTAALVVDAAVYVTQHVKPLEGEPWPLFASSTGETTTAFIAKFAHDTYGPSLESLFGDPATSGLDV